MKSLFESHIGLVGRVLDMQLERQNVVMSNLANIQTPGYKSKDLKFEDELQAALGLDAKGKVSRTNAGHMPSAFNPDSFESDLRTKFEPRVVAGLDSVDLDKEMAKMSKNSLQYNTLASILKTNFEGIRTVITEGQK